MNRRSLTISKLSLLWLLALSGGLTSAEASRLVHPVMQLRFEWGGQSAEVWSGVLELNEGRIENPRSLGIEADEPGTLWIDQNALWIQRRNPRVYDGFDIRVQGPPTAVLSLSLQSAGAAQPRERIEIQLSDLYARERVVPLNGTEQQLVIRRAPGDSLAVHIDRPHLIYAPREDFNATVTLNLLDVHDRELPVHVDWQLLQARTNARVLAAEGQKISVTTRTAEPATVPIRLTLPESEGVYDLQIRATGRGLTSLDRTVQLVVLSPSATDRAQPLLAAQSVLVDEFHPDSASIFRRIPPKSALRERFVARAPAQTETDPHDEALVWSANRLRIEHPGRPHLLIVSVPRDHPQQIGISLIEPNAAGQVIPVGLDSGLIVPPHRVDSFGTPRPSHTAAAPLSKTQPTAVRTAAHTAGSSAEAPLQTTTAHRPVTVSPTAASDTATLSARAAGHLAAAIGRTDNTAGPAPSSAPVGSIEHRVLFWPRLRDPVLLLHNFRTGQPLHVQNVQVLELGEHLPPAPRDVQRETGSPRLVGPYMHKPLLPENFGAWEFFDAPSRRSLDDWQTFHTAGERLVEYLHYHGHNALLLAVMADGSSLYPSRLLDPSPRYDTGVFASAGHDPLRKDVVELLFQMFDREQLALVPELQFSTPLPALEHQIAMQPEAARGIQLIGRDGRPWTETHGTQRGLAPYYNPLDPRVQQAVIEVVREFAQRYQSHPSFKGLALELGHLGYLQLPGLEWGYDDQTIERFEAATRIRVPRSTGGNIYQQRYDFLTKRAAAEWTRWRCAELAEFHLKLAHELWQVKPQANVFLSGHRLFGDPRSDRALQQVLQSGGSPEQVLPAKGIDLNLYSAESRLIFLRPTLEGVPAETTAGPAPETLHLPPAAEVVSRSVGRGLLMYNLPRECRIAEFDDVAPWRPAFTWLIAHVSTAEPDSARNYVRALAALDTQAVFQGGWMIPLGQEEQTRSIRAAISALPAVRFQQRVPDSQPVIVRTATHDGKTWLYAVNDGGLPVRVALRLACPADTACWQLGSGQRVTLSTSGDGQPTLHFSLEGYGAWCGVIHRPQVDVLAAGVSVAQEALVRLKERVESFQERMNWLRDSGNEERTSPLLNPGFEQRVAGKQNAPPGWDVAVEQAAWSLDRTNPRSGAAALCLTSGTAPGALVTSELSLDDTRFFTMSLWLRSSRPETMVRLSLEGDFAGRVYQQRAVVQAGTEWKRYIFRVQNLPAGKLDKPRVRIEPLAKGQLWIDDVEIHAQSLAPDDVRHLMKTFAAVKLAWEEQRYADCQRMLEGYWGQFLFQDFAPAPGPAPASARAPGRLRNLFHK